MNLTLALLAGVLLDRLFGEVPRYHPLVGFGRLAHWLEGRMNRRVRSEESGVREAEFRRTSGADPTQTSALRPQSFKRKRLSGLLAWCLLVAPPVLLAAWLKTRLPVWGGFALDAIALYFALGARSLAEHARAVAGPLGQGRMEEARRRVSYLVSRETAHMDEEAAARATVESVLENGSDAIFGAIFWCALLGAPGAIAFRLANTLDAMWGYRNTRFEAFGWAAARLDDVLGYLPARLTATSYALTGQTHLAFKCWRRQANAWSSPNAGPVMSAGAGALGLSLGGSVVYEGEVEARPTLGEGPPARAADIPRALGLISRSLALWLALIGLVDVLFLVS